MNPSLKSRIADAVTAIRSGLHVSHSVMKKLLQDVHDTAADPKADRDALEYVFGSISSMDWRYIVDKKMTPPWPLEHHAKAMGLFRHPAEQSSEWVPVRRSDLIDWAQDWQVDHGTGDGDIVTPFDSYLLRTPKVETTPVPLDAPPPKFAPQPPSATAYEGGFTAADMMDARQEGRKEAQQPAPTPPVGVPVDVVREYLDARACYEAATRPPNSHAPAPTLKHDDPDARRLREARVALDNAIAIAQQLAAPTWIGIDWAEGQQPASDGGFTAADMMDARQEGRKEALAAQQGGES